MMKSKAIATTMGLALILGALSYIAPALFANFQAYGDTVSVSIYTQKK